MINIINIMIIQCGLQVQQTHFTGKDVQEQTPFLSLQNESSQRNTHADQKTVKLLFSSS